MNINIKTKYNIGDKLYKVQEGQIRKFKIISIQVSKCFCNDDEDREDIIYLLQILQLNGVIYEEYGSQHEKTLDKEYFKTQEGLINYLLKTAQQ